MAADESGVFSSVKSGIEAGGRPLGSDGLQTFGGIRSLARYVKIVAVPSSGGKIGINEASNAMPSVRWHVLFIVKCVHILRSIGKKHAADADADARACDRGVHGAG